MNLRLNSEISNALIASGDARLKVVDPTTNRVYVLLDEETHTQAMQALEAMEDRRIIAERIAQMEAGAEEIPLDEAIDAIIERLELRRR